MSKLRIYTEQMGAWELEKATYLLQTARKIGMDITGFGEVAVNQNSGYTYIWLEDYQFCLYMPISCDLSDYDVMVSYSDPMNGEEFEESLVMFKDGHSTISNINNWVDSLINEDESGEEEEKQEPF